MLFHTDMVIFQIISYQNNFRSGAVMWNVIVPTLYTAPKNQAVSYLSTRSIKQDKQNKNAFMH
jgi:hypothetical protein